MYKNHTVMCDLEVILRRYVPLIFIITHIFYGIFSNQTPYSHQFFLRYFDHSIKRNGITVKPKLQNKEVERDLLDQ
jgi:hypothetical protein